MERISVEDFKDKIDSLYRLVIVAARRANQVSKPENRPLVPVRSKKATIVALEEILQDKVGYTTELTDDENLFE
jgi:DNA-directed RNA polymerase omega subunit